MLDEEGFTVQEYVLMSHGFRDIQKGITELGCAYQICLLMFVIVNLGLPIFVNRLESAIQALSWDLLGSGSGERWVIGHEGFSRIDGMIAAEGELEATNWAG
jgi:hypothetical protein